MRLMYLLAVSLGTSLCAYGRQHDSSAQRPPDQGISETVLNKLDGQYNGIDHLLEKGSLSMVDAMQRQEAKLRSQLARKDSTRAAQLFAGSAEVYAKLRSDVLNVNGSGAPVSTLNAYIPRLDSIATAMHFLQGAGAGQALSGKAQAVASAAQQLQGRLQAASVVQQFVRQREQQLKDQLASYGLQKQLLGMNKSVYYYQQQVAQYKSMLTDKQKYQDAALNAIRQSSAMQGFIAKHSWLSQLFPAPAAAGTAMALAGSQTASSVEAELKQRLGGLSTDPMGYMKQQVGSSQGQIDAVQSKLESVGNLAGGGNATVPDFTPNTQRTKPFLKRLEFGINIQSQKPSYLLPTSSALGLTLGYRISDKATAGIGASYSIGWGNSIDHIQMSSQGGSFRSFVDIRARGSFWITGAYEYNYFNVLEQPGLAGNPQAWQSSALIGLTKKYRLGSRSGNLQLLFDLLYKDHTPQTQPLVFRVGYQL